MSNETTRYRADPRRTRHPNELADGKPKWNKQRDGWEFGGELYSIPVPPNSPVSFAIARLVGKERRDQAYRQLDRADRA